MINIVGGKITKNYRAETFMVFCLDRLGREFLLDKCPILHREWYKDKKGELTAVEKACGSFLYQSMYKFKKEEDIPYSKLKVLYYRTEMGEPRSREILYISLNGSSKIRLSKGAFSLEIEGAEVKGLEPVELKLEILKANGKKRHNLLIRRDK